MKRTIRYLAAFLGCCALAAVVVFLIAGNRSGTEAKGKELPAPVVSDDNGALPANAAMEKLAREDPVAFLENCIRRYNREVKGYTCTLRKQERVDDRLRPSEVIEVAFKEKPFSVYMDWSKGAGKADRVLYVPSENDGKLLAHPSSSFARKLVGDIVAREDDNPDTQRLKRFGMKIGTERTLASWKAAKDRGHLDVKLLGEIKVKEADDRLCWRLRWTPDVPQDKGVTELTIYVDKDTWLQVGSVMKGEEGKLVAEYYFRDIRLNPKFKPDQFEKAALTQ